VAFSLAVDRGEVVGAARPNGAGRRQLYMIVVDSADTGRVMMGMRTSPMFHVSASAHYGISYLPRGFVFRS